MKQIQKWILPVIIAISASSVSAQEVSVVSDCGFTHRVVNTGEQSNGNTGFNEINLSEDQSVTGLFCPSGNAFFNPEQRLQPAEQAWYSESRFVPDTSQQIKGLRKQALKLDFVSLAFNTLTLNYEKQLRPMRSVEFSLGAIGLGFGLKEEDAKGILLRGGYKFFFLPLSSKNDNIVEKPLHGLYLKPEFDFASYKVTGSMEFFSNETERYQVTKFALLMLVGTQYVIDNSFLVDVFTGIGLGTNNLDELDSTFPYGFTTFGDDMPLGFSIGFRLGFLF